MPRIHSLHLFLPHIAERGLLYFQQGKVRDVQKLPPGVIGQRCAVRKTIEYG